jgi:ArsR family transcriptional regulator
MKNEPAITCDCDQVHDKIVAESRKTIPEDENIFRLADFMSMFSDSSRVRILWALDGRELCVCDIAALLGMTKSAVSHQLRLLRDNDLVRNRRAGREIYYSLADGHVREILEKAMEHINEKRN